MEVRWDQYLKISLTIKRMAFCEVSRESKTVEFSR